MVFAKKTNFSGASANSKNPKRSSQRILQSKKMQMGNALNSISKAQANNALSILNKENFTGKYEAQKFKKQTKITSFVSTSEKENIPVKRSTCKGLFNNSVKNLLSSKENYIPVWKQFQATEENKESQIFDVYDMSGDEQMQHEDKYEKKKAKRPKATARKNIKSKVSKKVLKAKTTKCDASLKSADPEPNYENIPAMNEDENVEPASSVVVIHSTKCPPIEPIAQPLPSEQEMNEPHSTSVNENPIIEPTAQSLPSESGTNELYLTAVNEKSFEQDKTVLLTELAEEIERSFLMPLMTSTPTERPQKEKDKQQKVLDHSLMQASFEARREPSPPTACRIQDSVDKEIQLFESPRKKQKSNQAALKFPEKCPKKSLNTSEDPTEVLSDPEVETSVLLPNKSYHSPDNFKVHLVRTKRFAVVHQNCSKKKTKEQLMIEKLNKHFEEVDQMELCIE